MPDEQTRKRVILEYCRRINSGDVAATLGLFAPDARYEDPAGSTTLAGLDAVREHLADVVRGHVYEVPGIPVASFDEEHVVLPAQAFIDGPGARLRVTFIALARVGPDELIHEMRLFWGRSDVTAAAPEELDHNRSKQSDLTGDTRLQVKSGIHRSPRPVAECSRITRGNRRHGGRCP